VASPAALWCVCRVLALRTTWRGTKRPRGRPGGRKGANEGATEGDTCFGLEMFLPIAQAQMWSGRRHKLAYPKCDCGAHQQLLDPLHAQVGSLHPRAMSARTTSSSAGESAAHGGATQSRVAATHSEAEQATNSAQFRVRTLYKLNHADNPPTGSQRASKSFLKLLFKKTACSTDSIGRVLGTGRGITHRSSTLECAVSPSSVRGVKRASCSSTLRVRASVRVASCVSGVQICILRSTLRAFTPEA